MVQAEAARESSGQTVESCYVRGELLQTLFSFKGKVLKTKFDDKVTESLKGILPGHLTVGESWITMHILFLIKNTILDSFQMETDGSHSGF